MWCADNLVLLSFISFSIFCDSKCRKFIPMMNIKIFCKFISKVNLIHVNPNACIEKDIRCDVHHISKSSKNQRFSETGSSNMKIILAREINNNHTEQVMNMVTNDPTISTRRIAARTGIPRSTVHRKLKREGFNPFYSFCFA